MATRLKRRFVSKNNQEQLLQDFYDNLDADDDTFLGHHFVDSDGDFTDDDSDYDNGGVDDDEEIPDDVEIEPNAEGADEAIEEPETIDEPLPVERPKKQKSKVLMRFWMMTSILTYRTKRVVCSSIPMPKKPW